MASKRRALTVLLCLLALFLLGTVAVLSTISFYLRIDLPAYITESELSFNVTDHAAEHIPRILHQTWKSETLPERWRGVSQGCRDLMPDYKYILWTDTLSREFIATQYPSFLSTFDAYPYPIQRADAIRYFVLHYFGGIYLDLDIGCLRPLDPLLNFPVILPKTIPVGVSNDLMFAARGHPFMEQTIHNLITFDHSYILNYPTVMFSTGPMFLSAQYGLYTASHPAPPERPGGEIRILPKSLYGKNAKPGEAPNSFFEHHYGSSWHADDAAFVTFLGHWGKALIWLGVVVLVLGCLRLIWQRHLKSQHGERPRRPFSSRRYDVLLPRVFQRDGSLRLDLGFVALAEPSGMATEPTSPISAYSSLPPSPIGNSPIMSLGDSSTYSSEVSPAQNSPRSIGATAALVFRRAGELIRSSLTSQEALPSSRRRRSHKRGVMFFLPAIFTSTSRSAPGEHGMPLFASQVIPPSLRLRSRSRSPPAVKVDASSHDSDFPRSLAGTSTAPPPPPPYEQEAEASSSESSAWAAGEMTWDEWTGEDSETPA